MPLAKQFSAVLMVLAVAGIATAIWPQSASGAAGPQSTLAAPAALGHQAYVAGRYDAARLQFERALAGARAANDPAAEADARRGLGMVFYKLAKYAEARGAFEAALRLYEALGDRSAAAWTLHDLGWVANSDRIEPSDSVRSRGLEHAQAANDRAAEAQLVRSCEQASQRSREAEGPGLRGGARPRGRRQAHDRRSTS